MARANGHSRSQLSKILISWSGLIATAPKLRNIFIVLQNITHCSTIRKYAHYNAWTSVLEVRLDLPPAVVKACTSLPSYGSISIFKKRVLQTYLEHGDNLPSITEWSYCSDATIWLRFTVQHGYRWNAHASKIAFSWKMSTFLSRTSYTCKV